MFKPPVRDRRISENNRRDKQTVKQSTDAVGVEDVTAPAEMAYNVVGIVIGRANEAHFFDRPVSPLQQIFELDNR
ncbi:hypothetical protein L1887_37109 [Cichorium endivia]|nr:hypothetical protein L1887_37109 [Cichorium endivia]